MFAYVSLSRVSSVVQIQSGQLMNTSYVFLTVLDGGMYCQTLSYEDLFLDQEISTSCWISPMLIEVTSLWILLETVWPKLFPELPLFLSHRYLDFNLLTPQNTVLYAMH